MDNENKNTFEGLDADTFGTPSMSSSVETEEVKSTPFSGAQEVPVEESAVEEATPDVEPASVAEPVPVAAPVYTQASTAQVQSEKSDDNQELLIMILGIVSVVMSCCCNLISIPTGIIAIVLAIGAKNKTGEMTTMMMVGLICGIVGVVFSAGGFIVSLLTNMSGNYLQYLENFNY